jgi:2-polyprenyl-6-methoxyphenol hydroxylase-like FAD-dependent oxidoreductase
MTDTVAIAGAGPVGLMLAGELALAGVHAVVLERSPEPRTISMGMAINAAVVELLHQRGLMDGLREDGLEWSQAHFAQLWLDPTRLSEPHEYTYLLPQTRLERHLEEWATKLGAEIRRGVAVETANQNQDSVRVDLRGPGGAETIECRYLVGCDGAHSTVRQLAGIDFPGVDSPFYGITGDFELTDELTAHFGVHQYDTGLFTVAPAEAGRLRVSTGEFEALPPAPDEPVTVAELATQIARLIGVELNDLRPVWMARWHDVTRQAATYRDGRVFLAGDAAHVHFPLGGQALSTGIEDAVNLGWKLAAELAGRASGDLLDSYHAERHPVGARACLTTRAQATLMRPLAQVGPLRDVLTELIAFDVVNEYLVRMAAGLDVRYPGTGPVHPLTGGRLPHFELRTADGDTDVARLLHGGRGVLLDLAAEPLAGLGDWAGRVDLVRAEPAPAIAARRLLLRPDGRVAWAESEKADPDGLRTALEAWFGAGRPLAPLETPLFA